MLDQLHQPGSVLFHGRAWGHPAREDTRDHALLLTGPVRVITGPAPEELPAALDEVQAELEAGRLVAGYMCYEAGRAFDLTTHEPSAEVPLYWFGVYEAAEEQTRRAASPLAASTTWRPGDWPPYAVPDMHLNVTPDEYVAALAAVKDYIAAGDTYQVNYTCHTRFAADLDPAAYFLALVRSHPVPYAAYLDIGTAQILSLSPELLLEKRGDLLTTKPMKGTRKRGRTPVEDAALREELVTAIKDRAENLMIVDMMRNDLGRVCEVGSVGVPVLFEAEKYRSVWQMTTTVTGRLVAGTSLRRIMEAVLPGSSVTGAPKKRTMEIIHELELEPRGVYCGAIGLFTPDGDFTLNLPIRTLVHRQGRYDLGIGSGIVWDSDPLSEYEETLLKSQFARRLQPDLRLFETMLVEGPAIRHEAEHLQRLAQSADYWDFPFDAEAARAQLQQFAAQQGGTCVMRMELDQEGGLSFTSRPAPAPPEGPVLVLISDRRTDSGDRFLYHKTSQRELYDREREAATAAGYFEVLFRNESGNLTEGAISNLFVRIGGEWLTPPLMEGLLPGIWRADFIVRMHAREQRLTMDDLARAEEIVIGNSVRGAIRVDEVVNQTVSG
jgi:para-aminobenzoate synthetase/4-amino-4-deoxychorismate lyase